MHALPNAIRKFLARVLPTSSKIVQPPGEFAVGELEEGPPIVVATFPRSGTHVIIDALLNNLPAYRNTPLYLDLDQLFLAGQSHLLDEISDRRVIVKTHHPSDVLFPRPSVAGGEDDLRFRRFVEGSVVVTVDRSWDQVERSLENFFQKAGAVEEAEYERFRSYWDELPKGAIPFPDLFEKETLLKFLGEVGELAGVECQSCPVFPPEKSRLASVYAQKMLSRMLGGRSVLPVNTTVGFDLG